MENFDLIIFDCDGVLVDSERIANTVFAEVLAKECDLHLSLEDMFETFVGRSSMECQNIIRRLIGKAPPEGMEERLNQQIKQALAESVEAVKGVEDVLREISIPICVASSGSHEKMQTTLGRTGLLKYFEGKLFSSSEVKRGKPFPDVYLYAAERMGNVLPSRCLVIEDTPLGVQGGVSAGMTVFGYAELMCSQRLVAAGAHHVFKDMRYLTRGLREYESADRAR